MTKNKLAKNHLYKFKNLKNLLSKSKFNFKKLLLFKVKFTTLITNTTQIRSKVLKLRSTSNKIGTRLQVYFKM